MFIKPTPKKASIRLSQKGYTRFGIAIVIFIAFAFFAVLRISGSHVAADSPKVTSGIKGYCLDVHHNSKSNNAVVDDWSCDNTSAQTWAVDYDTLVHNGVCLSVENNSTTANAKIVLNPCNSSPGQTWLSDKGGFYNPNSEMCLSASVNHPTDQLYIDKCNGLGSAGEKWQAVTANSDACGGSEGEKVACFASREWTTWQSGTTSHEHLLNNYTDGAPFEEWCADFVSYVYREAGYPFTNGETDGWNENVAANIQDQGFTVHQLGSGYVPKPGDVGFFDYLGGHVEIVVSGGAHPTFVYGNSAKIDPVTGNGQMEANTVTGENGLGKLQYYLSPN